MVWDRGTAPPTETNVRGEIRTRVLYEVESEFVAY